MQAVILAGGLGTRLRPLTYARSKPLLPIYNRALVDRVLDALPADVETVVVPLSKGADDVRAHLRARADDRVIIVPEPEPRGSGGALKLCQPYLDEPFFVLNADIVSSLSLQRLASFHHVSKALATISLWPVEEPWHFGVVKLGPDNAIDKFVEKPPRGTEPTNLINAGHYIVDPSLLDRIPTGKPCSLEADVFAPMSNAHESLYGMRFKGFWVDAGRPETFLEAHRSLGLSDPHQTPIAEGVEGVRDARFRGYAVGAGSWLGQGATVERSVLFSRVRVAEGAFVRDSIVGEGAEIGAFAVLENCVVADGIRVPDYASHRGERLGMRGEHLPVPAAKTLPPKAPTTGGPASGNA